MALADRLQALAGRFKTRTGRSPDGIWAAPGRVNLIGEHTDYNDGFVLPFALPQRVLVAAGRRRDGWLGMASMQRPEAACAVVLTSLDPGLTSLDPGRGRLDRRLSEWAAYPAGVAWALGRAGHHVGGADLLFDGDVPAGAGLASSAALECAAAVALDGLYGLGLPALQLAHLARAAENDFVGVPCGLMDQAASMLAAAGHALLLDTRTVRTEQIPLDPRAAEVDLLVIDTQAPHALVDGEYAARRAACREAARRLAVPALRDLDPLELGTTLRRLDDPLLARRVRHVVSENGRVLQVADLLRGGQLAAVGALLLASHASLRDDYQVSSERLDLAVDAVMSSGALGARLTGAGFGGCVIALIAQGAAAEAGAAVAGAFGRRAFCPPVCFTVEASAGATRLV